MKLDLACGQNKKKGVKKAAIFLNWLKIEIDYHFIMTTTIKEKVFQLQAELEFIKKAFEKEPDFDIDEENWRKIKADSKKIRAKLYQIRYGKK